MKKKILSLLLVGAMAVGMLAGCGKQAEDPVSSKPSESEKESTSTVEESSEDEPITYEPVTIKILGTSSGKDVQENWQEVPVGKALYDDLQELGITLEFEWVAGDALKDIVNTRMAAGVELPDIIGYGWENKNSIIEWGQSGLVKPVNELLDKYDTDNSIREFIEKYGPGLFNINKAPDGNNYWFSYFAGISSFIDPHTGNEVKDCSKFAWEIRKDWVEAVGEEVKQVYTLDELITLLKKMRDQDANGNGKADEIIYTGIDSFNTNFALQFGLNSDLICGYASDGKGITANIYNERLPEYIEFMQDLYESGLYDTETISTNLTELVGQDRIALYHAYYSIGRYDKYLPGYDENDLETNHYVPILIDPDGDLSNGLPLYTDASGVVDYTPFFIPSASENEEAIVRLFDYIYSERYGTLCILGLEGEDRGWYRNEDGFIVNTPYTEAPEAQSLANITVAWQGLPIVPCAPVLNDLKIVYGTDPKFEWGNDLVYKLATELYPISIEKGKVVYRTYTYGPMTDEESAFMTENGTVLQTYMQELLTDLILGRKSLDDLATYQKELQDLGIDRYVEITQARYDRVFE